MKIQVTARKEDGTLHFQVGELHHYRRFNLKLTGKEKFSGLKKTTSLYGSKTEYRVIPVSAFKNKSAFRAKHNFTLSGVEKVYKQYINGIGE